MKDYDVFLSPLAEYKLDYILEYIQFRWGDHSKNRFLDKLDEKIQQISTFPQSCPSSHIKKDVRKSVITPQTSLYYRIYNQTVEVITVIDNRQDPEKTANEIEQIFQ